MDYSERVESLLRSGHKVTAEGEAVALIELSDCSKPHLSLTFSEETDSLKRSLKKN